MPYASVADLPPAVREKLPPVKRRQWREVFNAAYARHGDESRAFAEAWSVAQKFDETENTTELSKEQGLSMSGFSLFAQLQKIDAAARIVTGIAANEALDKSGERFHYQSSAPEFRKWSAEIQKGSAGKSLGNVRIMHQPVVAGILTEMDCDDATKSIRISAKIVNDDAWKMVEAGAYTGFSIGGRYAKRWSDPSSPAEKWYTAIPAEVSVVDLPCNPDAHFEMVKADGTVEVRPLGRAAIEAAEAEDETVNPDVNPDDAKPDVKPAVDLQTAPEVVQRWLAGDGTPYVTKGEALKHNEQRAAEEAARAAAGPANEAATRLDAALALAKGGDAPGDGSKPYGNVSYADDGLRDGRKRYPIDTEGHIRAAWSYIHQGRNAGKYTPEQAASIKRKIAAAWRSKIDPKGPPEAAQKTVEGDESATLAVAIEEAVKSLWHVGRVACLIEDLRCIKDELGLEAAMESEPPESAEDAQNLIDALCGFLVRLVAEETQEIRSGEEIPAELALAVQPIAGDVAKALADLGDIAGDTTKTLAERLDKIGSRHNRADQARLDLAHHALEMAQGMGGLSKADSGHVERALGALREAGAAPGPHYQPGHNATVDTGHNAVSVPQGHPAPGPHYRLGENSTVDTGHPAIRVPQGSADASGRGKGIEMVKAVLDLLEALAKRHGGHKALLDVAHDLVAKVAGESVCAAMKAGARHSAETMQHLAAAHDEIAKAGGMCKASGLGDLPPDTAPTEGEDEHQGAEEDTRKLAGGDPASVHGAGLAKRDAELAALKKAVDGLAGKMDLAAEAIGALVGERDDLKSRLEKVEEQPLPPKTIARPSLLPGLAEPSDEQIAAIAKNMTQEDLQILLIKKTILDQLRG